MKKKLLTTLALLLTVGIIPAFLPYTAFAAVGVDNSALWAGGICGQSGTNTVSYTMGAGSNGIIIVLVPTGAITSVKYAGQTLTKLADSVATGYSYYYLQNPTTGANNVSVTRSVSASDLDCVIASFTGVLQSGTPLVGLQNNSASATSISNNYTSTTAGSYIIDFLATSGSPGLGITPITPTGTGHVSLQYFYINGGDQVGGGIGYTPAASVSTYTIGYSCSNSSTPWEIDYYELLPQPPPSAPPGIVSWQGAHVVMRGGNATIR